MTRFLDDALAYAAREWSILPVGADKKPAIRKWKRWQSEPADEKQLRKWFNKVGLHGMAVVCGPVSGGLVVRDFDTMDAYNRWAREHIELAGQLPTVATARGRHVYFRNSLDRIITVESNGEHEGELRGAGYVLLPPSRHPSGATYRWTVALPEGPIRHVEDPAAAGLVSAGLLQLQAAPVQQREQRQQRQTEITQDMACGGEGENGRLIQDIIGATQPRTVGQRNRAVFELARALKAVPTLHDADPRELQAIVVEWHEGNGPMDRLWAIRNCGVLEQTARRQMLLEAVKNGDRWERVEAIDEIRRAPDAELLSAVRTLLAQSPDPDVAIHARRLTAGLSQD